jgi:Zinc binding domain
MTNALCPVAGKCDKPVPLLTLRSLLLPEDAAIVEGRDWFFCDQPDCDVVYFARDGATFSKAALKVRVGLKEKESPRTLCYCFGHTVESIRQEIERTSRSTVAASIKEKVSAGQCRCEILNPKGTCCLGDVNRVVKDALEGADDSRPGCRIPGPAIGQEKQI